MQINSIDNNSYNRVGVNPVFCQGLTEHHIEAVRRMGLSGYRNTVEKIRFLYGVKADVGKSNVVALCMETAVKIMRNAGFELPALFSFEAFSTVDYGRYYEGDRVCINSNFNHFYSLEEQNKFSEDISWATSGSKHFLSTYMHEFSHAAHRKNLIRTCGETLGNNIFWKVFTKYNPKEVIAEPVNRYFKKYLTDKDFFSEGDEVSLNLFNASDLTEYFAMLNTKKISDRLGKDSIIAEIEPAIKDEYSGLPEGYNLREEVIKNPEKAVNDIIRYFNSAIWNGDIKGIKSMVRFLNKG